MRRRLLLAAPAIIAARGAAAMMPFVAGAGNTLSTPLLDQLSGGTTVIGAWSVARKLKSGQTIAFYSSTVGGAISNAVGFSGAVVNTAALLGNANFALYGGAGGATSFSLIDQTGNGNTLGRGNANSTYCRMTDGAGALNAPVACTGGFSAPMFSVGYNGLSAGNNGPFLGCASGAMSVSYGAASQFFCFAVVRQKNGTGAVFGSMANFIHTGDATASGGLGSVEFLARLSSTTTGAVYTQHASGGFSNGIAPVGAVSLLGSVYDGANNTVYIDRVGQTPAAYTGALAAGGSFAAGDWANAGAFGTQSFAGDIAEIITGTTLAASDLTLIQANMHAFYGTP